MTDDMMTLRSIAEKSVDADLPREMIGFAAEKLMALEVKAKTGAGYGKKNGSRRWVSLRVSVVKRHLSGFDLGNPKLRKVRLHRQDESSEKASHYQHPARHGV